MVAYTRARERERIKQSVWLLSRLAFVEPKQRYKNWSSIRGRAVLGSVINS